ncbi:MAG TPA: peptidase S10 [Bryobacteraceae bacterium]
MRRIGLWVVVLSFAVSAFGQGRRPGGNPESGAPPANAPAGGNAANEGPPAVEKFSKTQHSIHAGGSELAYTATAGTLVLKKDDGKPKASIFFVAYSLDNATDKSKRPLTFSFNGGPGSSSVWLHMGALGPRKVSLPDDGSAPKPPYQVVDNEQTCLKYTDLVFIDPVSTGFSRAAPGESAAQFHGYDADLEEVGDFIRLYLTKFDRWSSPKFLAGESYGTTRAAGLSEYLLRQDGIYLNGISLISSVLNFETINFAPGHDLPYILYLPSYTASAWYHKKLPADLQGMTLEAAVEQARKFAGTEYALALMKGDKLTAQERSELAKKLARFTGLDVKYIVESNYRVQVFRYFKELMRGQRRTTGRYDDRLEGIDLDAAGERAEYDPSYAAVQGAFTAAFNDYVRTELKWESDIPYEILTGKVQPWSYARQQNQYLNVSEPLREAITQNPAMHVLSMNGYYDMATPFYATEYVVSHMGLDPTLTGNISFAYCDAGHMMYTRKNCLEVLSKAMADLYTTALKAGPAGGKGGPSTVR